MKAKKTVFIVIFGASGDLTARKLMPAIHSPGCEGLLPEGIRVIGVEHRAGWARCRLS